MRLLLKGLLLMMLCLLLFPLDAVADNITVYTSSISEGTVQLDSQGIEKDVKLRLETTRLLKEYLHKFDNSAFSGSPGISLGDEETYLKALESVDLVYDSSIDSQAEYQPPVTNDMGQVFRRGRFVFNSDIGGGAINAALPGTIWHEVTHVIEGINGDDENEKNDDDNYRERHIEYMEQASRAMDKLMQLEKSAQRGDEVKEMKKYWEEFLSELKKAPQQPGPAAYPVEEARMLGWFGFKAFPDEVLKHYASGAGGDKLKELAHEYGVGKAAANTGSDDLGKYTWEGQWDSNWGKMVLTQKGSTVTGNYTHDSGRIEGVASGNKMTGTWSEAPSYVPDKDAGDIEFIMSADGSTFSGSWGYGSNLSGGDWTGSKRLTPVAPAPSSDKDDQKKIILQINHPNISAEGQLITLDSPPVLQNGRTLLPIRAIAEAMGGDVKWDNKEKKVTINAKGSTVEMWMNKDTIRVNGQSKSVDAAPTAINGRTMVPVRFVADNLPGCDIIWDNATKSAVITY